MNLEQLENQVKLIYDDLLHHRHQINELTQKVHIDHKVSAVNLINYLLMRKHDLRNIHQSLSDIGLSSLRSNEAYVAKNVSDVLGFLRLAQDKTPYQNALPDQICYSESLLLIKNKGNQLFGRTSMDGATDIMVTLPSEAAEDEKIIRDLLVNGMNIARINCSHDSKVSWQKMIKSVKKLRKELGLGCKIYMDLPGPKIRTRTLMNKHNKIEPGLKLKNGDFLVLYYAEDSDKPGKTSRELKKLKLPLVQVSHHELITDLNVGERVFFDDGKIESSVIDKQANFIAVQIRSVEGSKLVLKSEKGINVPDTNLRLPSLTKEDLELLPFVLKHADLVGYSFLRTPHCVEQLLTEIRRRGKKDIGLILKIENNDAFRNLPAILLKAMEHQKLGVMIARGDLAVELGPIRLAEAQDEILWICEAAHIPVIWATQVLENLAKKGISSRAEITDAAKSARAECVMLNKGPYIVQATKTLENILQAMGTHTRKKKSLMRPLGIAKDFFNSIEAKEALMHY